MAGKIRRSFATIFAAFVQVFAFEALAAGPTYVAVPLGTLGGARSYAAAINDSGAITGSAVTKSESVHAFVHSDGKMRDLGTLGGPNSYGRSINSAGQVVGDSDLPPPRLQHAFLSSGGLMHDLGTFDGITSVAFGINASGQVVGQSSNAFLYSNGVMSYLGSLGGQSSAFAINASGQITGGSFLANDSYHAFLYSAGKMQDIGLLGNGSLGNAINSGGDVVGFFGIDMGIHAFFYSNGAMRDLGTLGGKSSEARAINASGHVTGYSDIAGSSEQHAFLYRDGTMHDLNELVVSGLSGYTLVEANGINDVGQIAVTACDRGVLQSLCRAYRLDPASVSSAIEYHHADFDHYFITAIPDEIDKLDNGAFQGWTRTGESFHVYTGAGGGLVPVCRFFTTAFPPTSSHFYASRGLGCEDALANVDWQFEGEVFYASPPDGNGGCPTGAIPVYRLYNDGQGGAPNHRFTTSLAIRSQMLSRGFIAEGLGVGVAMCSPS